jgi:hypothetical protein
MKKLLLILLCLPMIGFGQTSKITKCLIGNCYNEYSKAEILFSIPTVEGITKIQGTYYGGFLFGKLNGQGKAELENGTIYEGRWIDAQRDGFGIYNYSYGDSYEGQLKNNMFHGKGTYTWANGDKYDGNYENDKKHGFGIAIIGGNTYKGYWSKGEPNGKFTIISRNGSTSTEVF